MAASLPVQLSIIMLGVIAGLYTLISVLLLVAICCVCYRKRKIRAVSPKKGYVSPQSSDGEHSNHASPSRNSLGSGVSSNAQDNKIPKRYRSKHKKKAEQTISCPEYIEGVRESPLLVRQRQAWSTEKLDEDLVISNPNTPDSGLASSLGDSKHGEGQSGRNSADSSIKSSHSGSNEDVFDDSVTAHPQNNSRSDEAKRDVRRRPPKPIRTESTTPLMDDDSNGLYTPGSEKEFDLKTTLPPIKEKARSPDSLDGTFFVNKSALTYSDGEKQQTYTELSSLPTRSLNLETLPPIGSRDILPPIRGGAGGQGQLVGRTGRLPPLHPPGHSQENLHELDEQSTTL